MSSPYVFGLAEEYAERVGLPSLAAAAHLMCPFAKTRKSILSGPSPQRTDPVANSRSQNVGLLRLDSADRKVQVEVKRRARYPDASRGRQRGAENRPIRSAWLPSCLGLNILA